MTLEQAAGLVLGALDDAGVAHMLVGGLTSNYYGIPRATQDVDVVVRLAGRDQLTRVADSLGGGFTIDAQVSFETITGNARYVIRLPATPFVVELFVLGEDRWSTGSMSGSTSRSTAVKKWPVLRCRLMAGSGCPPRNVTTYGESFGKSELSLAEAVPFLTTARQGRGIGAKDIATAMARG